jgi:hypothetical protein
MQTPLPKLNSFLPVGFGGFVGKELSAITDGGRVDA